MCNKKRFTGGLFLTLYFTLPIPWWNWWGWG